ncbi:unnamed protein product [Mytilus coruscus]|uniref:EGF-like domain-containing protein n=1 Tax=Mytilus coruscus TaxID=42192 RepID=A0A6J7ZVY6_MYTCO|nr:unnamed protein product [Mytilus coruscus]
MGWTFGSGPGCSNNKIGQFVNTTFIGDKIWKCDKGCNMKKKPVGTVFYYCTGANEVGSDAEKWEQGENRFQETFIGNGPFIISYTGAMWMTLDFGNPNGWNLQTTIDLRFRDDINSTNSSPITASKPLYTLQFSCYHELKLPMYDPDGDLVKCRWAVGRECDSVCHALPSASLDEDTCTLKFNASSGSAYKNDGWYAVALTFEDFPTKTIHVGKEQFNETTPMSTVPLQFLIHLVGKNSPCSWKPEFVSPTPPAGTKISISAGKSFTQKIYAANLANKKETVTKLSLTRPAGMVVKGPTNDPKRVGVVFWELSWTPTVNDQGNHIVCGMAEDSTGHTSDTRCITLIAWDSPDPCSPNPCKGNQTCSRIGSSQKVECVCPKKMKLIGQLCIADNDNYPYDNHANDNYYNNNATHHDHANDDNDDHANDDDNHANDDHDHANDDTINHDHANDHHSQTTDYANDDSTGHNHPIEYDYNTDHHHKSGDPNNNFYNIDGYANHDNTNKDNITNEINK